MDERERERLDADANAVSSTNEAVVAMAMLTVSRTSMYTSQYVQCLKLSYVKKCALQP